MLIIFWVGFPLKTTYSYLLQCSTAMRRVINCGNVQCLMYAMSLRIVQVHCSRSACPSQRTHFQKLSLLQVYNGHPDVIVHVSQLTLCSHSNLHIMITSFNITPPPPSSRLITTSTSQRSAACRSSSSKLILSTVYVLLLLNR